MGDEQDTNVPAQAVGGVLALFLLDVLDRVPADLEIITKALQQQYQLRQAYLDRLEKQFPDTAPLIRLMRQAEEYDNTILHKLGDVTMLSTVMRPMAYKMRELADQGVLVIGFSNEEWSNGFGKEDR